MDRFRDEDGDKRSRNLTQFRKQAEAKVTEVFGPKASIDTV